MQEAINFVEANMKSLNRAEWYAELEELGESEGFYEPLGERHAAAFVEQGDTLIVTFESRQGIQALSETGQPLAFDLIKATGWSHLALISEGDTWFRDSDVFGFFEDLEDDGFFDEFDRVLFYGAGPCGYAAAAFSRAAQDAIVVAIQPQATLDPRVTNWDERFVDQRRLSFSGAFGYAPEFVDLTERTFVIFDPRETLDAMHAALFIGPNATLLRTPFMGGAVQSSLVDMALLYRILARAGDGTLDERWFYDALRARRDYPPYLRNLMATLERDEREQMLEILCTNVTSRMTAPRFERRLNQIRQANAPALEA